MKREELEAREEVAEIDEAIALAQNSIKTLAERRKKLLKVAEETPRLTASLLHAIECKSRHDFHGSDCSWDQQNRWDWEGNPRKTWITTARNRVEASGETEEDFLAALRTIASHHQLEKAAKDFKEAGQ